MTDLANARHRLTGEIQKVRPDVIDVPGGFFESVESPKSSAPVRAESKETDTPVLGDKSKE